MSIPTPGTPPRHSRPMHVLAGLAYVPLLGLLPGFIALCWGLVSDRPRAMRAAVIASGGMLLNFAGCGALAYWGITQGAGREAGRANLIHGDLTLLVSQLERARVKTGRYPERLADLRVAPFDLPSTNIPDRGVGWFNRTVPYRYQLDPNGQHYVLYSVGLDGTADTDDDIYPDPVGSTREAPGLRLP